MRGDVFLDTNIVVYAFDPGAPEKQKRARALMAKDNWFTSWQVVQEFCAVASRKFEVPIKPRDLRDYLSLVLWPRCRVLPSDTILARAAEIGAEAGYSFYDSLVVASALAGGATQLLTEDLQDGRKIGPVAIVNPFR